MKRTIKLAVAAAVALTSTAAFATNGDSLIGLGAKARGMGGAGIAMSHGAESGLINPAMITSVKGTEISFGGTVFMPNVKTDVNMGQGFIKSDADLSVIPEVAIAQKASDNFYWGIGMFGTAGMGTDYRNAAAVAGNYNMVTNLQLMQFAIPLAYKTDGLSIGVAPVLQYGSLDINYNNGMSNVGTGVAQNFGFGYNLGASYEVSDVTFGLVYKSKIDMTYNKVLTTAASNFGLMAITDHLEQPAEMGAGVAYKMGNSTIALDYKKIKWSDAKGYKDFGWDDQNVYILGYQFAQDNWALRAGYNHGKSPIKEQAAGAVGTPTNVLNLLGFPAIVENHYTLGGTYEISKSTAVDLAYAYSPEATNHFNAGAGAGYDITTKHSQKAVTAQLNFKF